MNVQTRKVVSVIGALVITGVVMGLLGIITWPVFYFIRPNAINTVMIAVCCGDLVQQGFNSWSMKLDWDVGKKRCR